MNLADIINGRRAALTVSEVAGILSVSERQVYKLAASNRIPSFRIGGSVRFDPAAIADWLRQKMLPQLSNVFDTTGSCKEGIVSVYLFSFLSSPADPLSTNDLR
jgi:excisionase family DNA binding protein